MRPALYLAALLGLTLSVQGQSSIVYNGNFEGGWNNGPLGWGWTDSVALTGDGLNNYAEVFGSLYQDLATSPGQPYSLNFRMAGNYPIMNLAILNVMWGEEMIGTVTWNSAGDDTNDPGWVYAEFDVSTDFTKCCVWAQPRLPDSSGKKTGKNAHPTSFFATKGYRQRMKVTGISVNCGP